MAAGGGGGVVRHGVGICGEFFAVQQDFLDRLGLFRAVGDKALAQHNLCVLDGFWLNHKVGGGFPGKDIIAVSNRSRNRVAACVGGNSCGVVAVAGVGKRHRNVIPFHSAGKFGSGGGDTAVSAAVRGNGNDDLLGGDGGSGFGLIAAFSQHIVVGRIAYQRQIGDGNILLACLSLFKHTLSRNGQLVVFQNTVKLGIAVIQHSIGRAVIDFAVCRNAGNGNRLGVDRNGCSAGRSCIFFVALGRGERPRSRIVARSWLERAIRPCECTVNRLAASFHLTCNFTVIQRLTIGNIACADGAVRHGNILVFGFHPDG